MSHRKCLSLDFLNLLIAKRIKRVCFEEITFLLINTDDGTSKSVTRRNVILHGFNEYAIKKILPPVFQVVVAYSAL